MRHNVTNMHENPAKSALEEILKRGAQQLLQQAIQAEVDEYLETCSRVRDLEGKRMVTRNGYLPIRELQTGIGDVLLHQPRVRDKRGEDPFSSRIVPKYKRKLPSIEALIPELYLRGVSTGSFKDALRAILGDEARGAIAGYNCSA